MQPMFVKLTYLNIRDTGIEDFDPVTLISDYLYSLGSPQQVNLSHTTLAIYQFPNPLLIIEASGNVCLYETLLNQLAQRNCIYIFFHGPEAQV
jgi:hypothetical protein